MKETTREEKEGEGRKTHLVLPMNFWLSERLNCGLSVRHCTRRLPRKRERSVVVSLPLSVADESMSSSTWVAIAVWLTSKLMSSPVSVTSYQYYHRGSVHVAGRRTAEGGIVLDHVVHAHVREVEAVPCEVASEQLRGAPG